VRILRFFLVVAALTLVGGGFGAVVGGLFGYALPHEIRLSTKVETQEAPGDGGASPRERTQGKAYEVGVGPGEDSSAAAKGAALGAALGLTLGAILGLLVGILDQVLLRAFEWYGRRKETAPSA